MIFCDFPCVKICVIVVEISEKIFLKKFPIVVK